MFSTLGETLPGFQKRSPLAVLTGLFLNKASSNKYTQLSDHEDSFVSKTNGVFPICQALILYRYLIVRLASKRGPRPVNRFYPSRIHSRGLWYSISCKSTAIVSLSLIVPFSAMPVTATPM